MTIRPRKEIVSFDRPFALNGLDGLRPADSHEVETDEQSVQGVSFPAYRRLATWVHLPTKPGHPAGYPGVTEILDVDTEEPDAAPRHDAADPAAPGDGNSALGTDATTAESSDEKADLAAEERSEDDGMTEHGGKAADATKWAAERGSRVGAGRRRYGPWSRLATGTVLAGIKTETEVSGRPNPPWRPDSEGPPPATPTPPTEPKEKTVFGLARDLKTLVREDRAQRSAHAHRFDRVENAR